MEIKRNPEFKTSFRFMRPMALVATVATAVLFQLMAVDAVSQMHAGLSLSHAPETPVSSASLSPDSGSLSAATTLYCASTQSYYLSVSECTEGWQVFACAAIDLTNCR